MSDLLPLDIKTSHLHIRYSQVGVIEKARFKRNCPVAIIQIHLKPRLLFLCVCSYLCVTPNNYQTVLISNETDLLTIGLRQALHKLCPADIDQSNECIRKRQQLRIICKYLYFKLFISLGIDLNIKVVSCY